MYSHGEFGDEDICVDEDVEVSIDGVLSLTKQDTPADPPNNASTIWLDSNWDLKIKITNSSGATVTKTIVEYA